MVNLKHLGTQQNQITLSHGVPAPPHQPTTNNNNNNTSDCTVYLGDLDMEITERQLKDFFASQLNFPVLKVVKQPHSSFAHVTFYHSSVAKNLLDLAVIRLNGKHVRVMPFNQPSNFDPEANLIIKNLEPVLTETDIIQKFKPYGSILSCKLARDEQGQSKCYAYLQFEQRDSATAIIDKFNNTYWDERCDPDYKYRLFQDKLQQMRKANSFMSKNDLQLLENQLYAEITAKTGKKIYVGVFKKKTEYSKIKSNKEGRPSNLYVKNFGTQFGDRDLFNLFKAFGSIKSAKVRRMRVGLIEKPLGCGFVDFEYPEEAENARLALNGHQLSSGRVLSVTYADCKSRRLRKKLEQGDMTNTNESSATGKPQIILIFEYLSLLISIDKDTSNNQYDDEEQDAEYEELEETNAHTSSVDGDENSKAVSSNSSGHSTASVSPSVSPALTNTFLPSTQLVSFDKVNKLLYDRDSYNQESSNPRSRNMSIGSTDSFLSSSSSMSSCTLHNEKLDQSSTTLYWPNLWSKVLNTSDWNEYKLFGSGNGSSSLF